MRKSKTATSKMYGLFSKGIAKSHLDGILTDEQIIQMTNEELENLAFKGDKRRNVIAQESYIAQEDDEDARRKEGDEYFGVHRAMLYLIKRARKLQEEAGLIREEQRLALESLVNQNDEIGTDDYEFYKEELKKTTFKK